MENASFYSDSYTGVRMIPNIWQAIQILDNHQWQVALAESEADEAWSVTSTCSSKNKQVHQSRDERRGA